MKADVKNLNKTFFTFCHVTASFLSLQFFVTDPQKAIKNCGRKKENRHILSKFVSIKILKVCKLSILK